MKLEELMVKDMNGFQQLHIKLQLIAMELNNIAENNEFATGALYGDIKKAAQLLENGVK